MRVCIVTSLSSQNLQIFPFSGEKTLLQVMPAANEGDWGNVQAYKSQFASCVHLFLLRIWFL